MTNLEKHEIFEIEVLEKLNSARLLDSLVFGGGTMLRLCHELDRFSADLDFWLTKKLDQKKYLKSLKEALSTDYELTDLHIKFHTILAELRSRDYPMRLKLEIRKKEKDFDIEERIAFSRHNTRQVALKVHTLGQTMKNKIEAGLSRREIRDFFDIEFLLRRGVPFETDKKTLEGLTKIITGFKDKDYKVTLGSVLEPEARRYYVKNKFSYLLETIRGLAK